METKGGAVVRAIRANLLAVVLAVVPPIVIWFYFQRETTELSVSLGSDFPIVLINKDFVRAKLEVKYAGVEISTLRAVEIKVENSGNTPITRVDFDIPLGFQFDGVIVAAPALIANSPAALPVSLIKNGDHMINLVPLLLNPADEFTFRTLIANSPGPAAKVKLSGRIMGVRTISINTDQQSKPWVWSSERVLAVLAAIVSLLSSLMVTRKAYEGYKAVSKRYNRAKHVNELRLQSNMLRTNVARVLESELFKPGFDRIDDAVHKVDLEIDRGTMITVDTRPLAGADGAVTKYPIGTFDSFGELTDEVYFSIQGKVDAFEYGWTWGMRHAHSDEVIKSARMIRNIRPGIPCPDTRTLSEVGISPGDELLVVRV